VRGARVHLRLPISRCRAPCRRSGRGPVAAAVGVRGRELRIQAPRRRGRELGAEAEARHEGERSSTMRGNGGVSGGRQYGGMRRKKKI
jgi:hypothetical protein